MFCITSVVYSALVERKKLLSAILGCFRGGVELYTQVVRMNCQGGDPKKMREFSSVFKDITSNRKTNKTARWRKQKQTKNDTRVNTFVSWVLYTGRGGAFTPWWEHNIHLERFLKCHSFPSVRPLV